MPYFACFVMHDGHRFRLDTRIYLRDEEPGDDDLCVAAIIGKNPGSAKGKKLGCFAPITLDGDNLLPYVRKRFRNAYRQAGVGVPSGAFVRVWNLFYLCNKTLATALMTYAGIPKPLICATEVAWPPIVWFAWGPPKPQFTPMQARFLGCEIRHPFYYDMDSQKVVVGVPGPSSRVKHTQGLPGVPIEVHLASLMRIVK